MKSKYEDATRAMHFAKKAFEQELAVNGYDAGFFRLQLKVDFMDANLETILETIEWKEEA